MTPDRFLKLAEAWGADLQRWPAHERAAAQALAAQARPGLRAALAEAAELDRLLAAHAVAAPDGALLQRVLAGAPLGTPAGRVSPSPRPRPSPSPRAVPRWWWFGAGAAGVGLAGALVGAMAVSMAMPALWPASGASDLAYASTAFGAPSHERSDE